MKTDREHLKEATSKILAGDPELAERLLARQVDPTALEMAGNFAAAIRGPALESMDDTREFTLETIVNRYGRPVLLVQGTGIQLQGAETEIWSDRLGKQAVRDALAAVIPAVGRIEVQNMEMDWLGTGWLASEDIVVTNRHVAGLFAMRGATGTAGFVFRRGRIDDSCSISARIDFRKEFASSEASEFKVVNILHIEDDDGPDIALLKVEQRNASNATLARPLRLASVSARKDQYVGTLGYPAADSRIPDHELVKRLFGDVYNVKRFAPGQILTDTNDAVTHNCSTLGGNSGSPIFDLENGSVVGLHFSGLFLRANYGVPSVVIASRLSQAREARVFPVPAVPPVAADLLAAPPRPPLGSATSATAPSDRTSSPNEVTVRLEVPVNITVSFGTPTIVDQAPSMASAPVKISATDAVEKARRLLGTTPGVLSVREGFTFRDGWITNDPAIVVVLRDSRARSGLRLPERIGDIPIEVRDPGALDFVREGLPVEEAVRQTTYKKPTNFSLQEVTAHMRVRCHVSPDAGWPTLKEFLGGTGDRLTIGMYDFSATHILDAVKAAVMPLSRRLDLVLEDLKDAVGGEGVKKDDISDKETKSRLRDAIGNRFRYASASVGKNHQFASAYHIKVAVRDGAAFWLSSGNWQSSNQHPETVDTSDWWALANLNREWHVVIENDDLALQFERYLRYDLDNALADAEEHEADESVEFFVSEEADEEQAPSGKPQYFEPLPIDREVTVRPLLTPDNYQEEVLALIESAEEQILFQNQSFSLLYDKDGNDVNDERFAELADALLAKQRAGLDVRIVMRGDFNPQTSIERLKMRGFDMARLKLQNHCHTKGIIVDRRRVLIGSHNWTNEGALVNRDASLIFYDDDVAAYYAKVFWFDWKKLCRASVGPSRRVQPVSRDEAAFLPPKGMTRISLRELFD